MAKNKSSFSAKTLNITAWMLRVLEAAVLLSVIGGALYLRYNPQTVSSWLGITQKQQPKTDIALIVDNLNQKIEKLDLIVQNDREKTALIERQFGYFDKSKADASQIISLNNKFDKLQNQNEKLAKTSNSGALILTAAMLVRDNVSHGTTCQKEAEALKILASGIDSLNKDIVFIADHCNQHFLSAVSVAEEFNRIYAGIKAAAEPKVEQNWKQRLTSKIGEYIKVSTPDTKNAEKQYDAFAALGKVKKLVDNGDFAAAADELEKPENAVLLENYVDIKEWYDKTRSRLEFYKALSNVASNALLIMKVEDARHESE